MPRDVALIVLHGATPGAEPVFADLSIIPVLNSRAQAEAWSALGVQRGAALPAHLQLDTGMARFGLSEADLSGLAALPGVAMEMVMSHLACADAPEHPGNATQIANFNRMRAHLPPCRASLSASSGIFLGPDAYFDLVRPGAALYGVVGGMEQVVQLEAVVLQVRCVPANTAVGYGHTQSVARPSQLATLGVGYADGFYRSLSGQGAAYLGDQALPIIGRISMDSMVVDATGVALAPGDLVELIGPHRHVDDMARDAGTIGYEVLTSLGRRFERRYIGG